MYSSGLSLSFNNASLSLIKSTYSLSLQLRLLRRSGAPETEIFDKSRNLYGLNYAKSSRSGNIILCEGYMDVISMHQAGFTQAVASLGTAFTPGQAGLLKKYTKDATNMIVAQRIGTIMTADKIVVLENGNCVGIGTHKELLENCEVYKEIALSQLSKEELEHA